MIKPAFCICKNKDSDQLHSNCAADQRLCFSYFHSTIPLLPKSKISILAIFCSCAAPFVSDVVRNPKYRFSHDIAHITSSESAIFCLVYTHFQAKLAWEYTQCDMYISMMLSDAFPSLQIGSNREEG